MNTVGKMSHLEGKTEVDLFKRRHTCFVYRWGMDRKICLHWRNKGLYLSSP